MPAPDIKAAFPQKLIRLFEPHRYKVLYGGRDGAKSWSVAQSLLLIAANPSLLGRTHSAMRILCARETQKSINDSVHALLSDQIVRLGLQDAFEVQQSTILGRYNTSSFIFAGLQHNVNNIKSKEAIDIVWVEEADSVSKNSWETLIPTIRKDNSEIWLTFNPNLYSDDTYQRFIVKTPPDALLLPIGWRDNPWRSAVLDQEREHLQSVDPDGYEHVYEGVPRNAVEGAVYKQEIWAAEKAGRITRVPYDPTRPLETFWDLGYADAVAIWFAQAFPFEYRIIDYLEASHKALEWYLMQMQRKEYTYGTFVLPWDGGAKSLGTGMSIEEILRKKGHKVRVLPQAGVMDGINAVRTIFPLCYFDSDRCADGIQRLRHYQWGPPSSNGIQKRAPMHDDASHGADALRCMAMHIRPPKRDAVLEVAKNIVLPPRMPGTYSPFG